MASSAEKVTYCHELFSTKSGDSSDEIQHTFILDGEYTIKNQYVNKNRAVLESKEYLEVECCKGVFCLGNILYKNKEPKIWEYIDLMIEATHNKEKNDTIFQKMGKSCPSKEVKYAYDGKLFVLYGRYIYGYDDPYVRFVNEKSKKADCENCFDEDDDDEEDYYDENGCRKELPASLSKDEIVLPTISYDLDSKLDFYLDSYNFSFSITDAQTQVLLAFALYR